MELKTIAELKATQAIDGLPVTVRDARQTFIYLKNRPDLEIDDDTILETPVANDRWVAEKSVPTSIADPSEAILNSSTGNLDSIASGTALNIAIAMTGAAPVLQGVTAREDGTRVTIVRAAAGPMTIKNANSATPADTIALPGSEDIILANKESATFIYVTTVGWMLVSIARKPTETKFIFKPSAAASESNIYKTFAELYAAFLQKAGEGRRVIELQDDGSGGGVTIPAGTYAGLFDDVVVRGVGAANGDPWLGVPMTIADGVTVTGQLKASFENVAITNNQATNAVCTITNASPAQNGRVEMKNCSYTGSGGKGLFAMQGANGGEIRFYCRGGKIDIQGVFCEATDDNGSIARVYDIPADAIITGAFKTSVGNTGGNALAFYFTTPTAAPDGNVSLTQVNYAAGDVSKSYNTYFAPPSKVAYIADHKSQGTNGGTSVSNTYTTRDLNTVERDPAGIILGINGTGGTAAKQFKLGPGTYEYECEALQDFGERGRLALYDISNAAFVQRSLNGYPTHPSSTYHVAANMSVKGGFTLTADTIFEWRHWVQNGSADSGFGLALNITDEDEIYLRAKIEKVA